MPCRILMLPPWTDTPRVEVIPSPITSVGSGVSSRTVAIRSR